MNESRVSDDMGWIELHPIMLATEVHGSFYQRCGVMSWMGTMCCAVCKVAVHCCLKPAAMPQTGNCGNR